MQGDGGPAAPWDYARSSLDEDETLLDARLAGEDFGCVPIEPTEGAALRFLATVGRARSVVEIGTGTGVSGLWLLRGMAPDGVLTSIDIEPEHQRAARVAFLGAGYPSSRLRLINGRALDVLPRLADAAYDLVFVDAVFVEYPRYLDEAIRLLRPGGMVALSGALPDDDPRQLSRDPDHLAVREVQRVCQQHDELILLPLPIGPGLLVAAKTLY
ncbi:MAG TPA: class I SAM-dependent methyltransferase [Pseudonocardia sp.]|nr:class I SAM-dependent methyltransferase [Pseudonocardia sp.]